MATEDRRCGTCQYWDPQWVVGERKVSAGLTQMGGVFGYCRALEEIDLPQASMDFLRSAPMDLVGAEHGRICATWTQTEEPHDTASLQKAKRA